MPMHSPIAMGSKSPHQLIVSEVATPVPRSTSDGASEKTLFRLWYNSTSVALLSSSVDVLLLENHEGIPAKLSEYVLRFNLENFYQYDLTKLSHLQHVVKKIRLETGFFLWIEKYIVKLTPLLEAALQSTQVVQKGFIESIVVASKARKEDESKGVGSTTEPLCSPTTVLEFSFDDAF